ncbi:metallophosphoesterase [Segetibacter sp. 3557_3]|uniref:metallophosphoesterase family protein n=1 Tax=Segetibacter sp. 3557_3 TaxID=2547429 RepID=UPI001058E661|nr:metallophosphoesterase [Segetibacter sp. 3557_3]TDH27035.1 metallophosphoesterase [Segetibacter sp. 3557_3]
MQATDIQIRTKPVFKKVFPDENHKFQPLPAPCGNWPYSLDIKQVLELPDDNKLVFHMVGDTGSVREPTFQHLVSAQMVKQITAAPDPADKPLFLYHLGDLVYKYGEAEEYYRQFFEPYKNYPNPVFAIPGNHDSDINPLNPKPYKSLDAFTSVFCGEEPHEIELAAETHRRSMIQPNVYWTLQTPVATIIGMYTNVPKYGVVTPEQRDWLISQLQSARKDIEKAVVLCLHHAPYSADVNHGSSRYLVDLLEGVFSEARAKPDIVFSGHVHNYQRFSKKYPDGKVVPFIVSGGGGYDELHPIAEPGNPGYDEDSPLFDNVALEKYCDHRHGFLKIAIAKSGTGLTINGEYYSLPHSMLKDGSLSAKLTDAFEVEVNKINHPGNSAH